LARYPLLAMQEANQRYPRRLRFGDRRPCREWLPPQPAQPAHPSRAIVNTCG